MATVYELGRLSEAVYDDAPLVSGWQTGKVLKSSTIGSLQAALFTKGTEKVVAFKGTSEAMDVVADLKIGTGWNSTYFSEAEQFCANYANSGNVLVTGHSLGGAIAQIVGNRRRLPFCSFNAPGVAVIASANLSTATPHMSAVRVAGGLLSVLRHPQQALRDMRSAFYVVEGVNFRLSGDVVSQIGLHYGPIITLQGSGLNQHGISLMNEVLRARGYDQIPFASP
ncbi:lipase family protein [Tropicimonas sp. S265A]|uniref:lipase family protein n=1 Tax=Tropicimonas sp. S265A TaxID=3415134 RepID=UPI003C7DDB2E